MPWPEGNLAVALNGLGPTQAGPSQAVSATVSGKHVSLFDPVTLLTVQVWHSRTAHCDIECVVAPADTRHVPVAWPATSCPQLQRASTVQGTEGDGGGSLLLRSVLFAESATVAP